MRPFLSRPSAASPTPRSSFSHFMPKHLVLNEVPHCPYKNLTFHWPKIYQKFLMCCADRNAIHFDGASIHTENRTPPALCLELSASSVVPPHNPVPKNLGDNASISPPDGWQQCQSHQRIFIW